MKLIRQLENLAFATRMRLLTERITQDGARVYKSLDIDFEPRWFALFYLLNEQETVAITEAALLLGYSQPAVTQTANIMVRKGLLKIVKEKNDTRKRLLTLTAKGKELALKLAPVWKAFEDSTNELFNDAGFDVLMVLDKLETELDKKDLHTRIIEKIKRRQSEQIEIIEYSPELCESAKLKESFAKLNLEWLNKYFSVEDLDKQILYEPEENILNGGGSIFFGSLNGEIVGTAAVLNHGNGTFEIIKMAVTKSAQGKQIGRKLATAAIDKARTENGNTVILESSRKLVSAMSLYRSLGFELVENKSLNKYERSTIMMELKL